MTSKRRENINLVSFICLSFLHKIKTTKKKKKELKSQLTFDLAGSTSTSMSHSKLFLLSTSMSLHSLRLSLRISVLRVDYDILNIRVPYLLLWLILVA